jgi:hypothetical protein
MVVPPAVVPHAPGPAARPGVSAQRGVPRDVTPHPPLVLPPHQSYPFARAATGKTGFRYPPRFSFLFSFPFRRALFRVLLFSIFSSLGSRFIAKSVLHSLVHSTYGGSIIESFSHCGETQGEDTHSACSGSAPSHWNGTLRAAP